MWRGRGSVDVTGVKRAQNHGLMLRFGPLCGAAIRRVLTVVFAVVASGLTASAQPVERVAVLMAETTVADDQVVGQLADALREGALRAKRETASPLTIMSRESMAVVLEDQGIDAACVEGNCEVETARNLGATYVLTGTLSRIEGTYVLTAKIHDVRSGDLLESDSVKNRQMIALMDEVEVLAHRLFRSELGQGQGLMVTTGAVAALESLDRGENRVYNTEAGETGLLVVKVTPAEAEVTINPGGFKGKGPALMQELAPDTYVITATVGRRYHPFRQEVTVEADGKLTVPVELKPAFGSLEVVSEPSGARVSVDGVFRGTTPLMLPEVLSGEHVVKVGREGFHTHTEPVVVRDEAVERVSTRLVSAIGGMRITSKPSGADVWLRGQRVGVTPFSMADLDPGLYPIRLSKSLHLDVSQDITVREGGVAEFFGELKPNYGSLSIRTEPRGATIVFDGQKHPKATPARLDKLQAGSYSVQLQLPGYGDWSEFVTIEPLKETTLSPTLQGKLGSLLVKARYPDGQLCTDEGSVFIAGERVGAPPYLGKQLAVSHRVEVLCKGMRGRAIAEVRHNERTEIEIPVAMFTLADEQAARRGLEGAVGVDLIGSAVGVGLAVRAAMSFGSASAAAGDASAITNADDGLAYQDLIDEARSARSAGVGMTVAATSVAAAVVWHWMKSTRARKAKLERIKQFRQEAGPASAPDVWGAGGESNPTSEQSADSPWGS